MIGMNVDNACGLFETAPRLLGDEKYDSLVLICLHVVTSIAYNVSRMIEYRFGLEFIEKNAEDVIQTHGFTSLSPSRVVAIVKDVKLDCSEERLFRAIVQWGKAECRRNGMDPDERALRGVLSDILPHIRFPVSYPNHQHCSVNALGRSLVLLPVNRQ
jgi:hypothetical protein